MDKLKALIDRAADFLKKYPTQVHIFFVLWNGFIVSWATKASIPLEVIGIPIVVNSSAVVSWFQSTLHMPTWFIGALTFVMNAAVAYISWKKKHVEEIKVPKGSVLIAEPEAGASLESAEAKDNVSVQIKKD